MSTNPVLEAAIEKNLDDDDAFRVYGDWLQSEGDPRGELVALQAALARAPRDKALARAVEQHLAAHPALAVDLPKVTVGWRLGFVERARLELRTPKEIAAALTGLVNHPSSRFLRSITIAQVPGAVPIIPAHCVDVLLRARKPATLEDLHLGTPGAWDPGTGQAADALSRTFPRLRQSVEAVWRAIMQTLGEQRRVELKYDAAKLPPLEPLPGVELGPVDAARVLAGLKTELDKRRPLGLVAAMRRAFTPASLDAFAVALGEQFTDLGETTATRWGFEAAGLLGHDGAAAWIGGNLSSWSHQRAMQGARMLAQMPTGLAQYELYGMIADPRVHHPRREEARTLLEDAADARELRVDQLLDRAVPFTAEGPVLVRLLATATRRFQADLIGGRRRTPLEFTRYVAQHPLLLPLAQRLLWASFDGDAVVHTFRLDGAGAPVDARGARVELGGRDVGVVHPLELPEAQRAELRRTWKKAFEKAKVTPLFPQLDRPTFGLREKEQGSSLARFKLRTAGFQRMREVLEDERGWLVADVYDQGGTSAWSKDFLRDQVRAVAHVGAGGQGIESLSLEPLAGRGARAFEDLHPVTLSEILHDVEAATTAKKDEAAEPLKVGGITKGTRVRVAKGAVGRLKEGVVFWLGEKNGVLRVGLRTDDGKTYWLDLTAVARLDDQAPPEPASAPAGDEADAPKPTLQKGDRVRWARGRQSGEGTVFWIGPNKFGTGTRVGVTDDETEETVWADADDCELLPT